MVKMATRTETMICKHQNDDDNNTANNHDNFGFATTSNIFIKNRWSFSSAVDPRGSSDLYDFLSRQTYRSTGQSLSLFLHPLSLVSSNRPMMLIANHLMHVKYHAFK
jgi:hypothetical protein